LQDFLKFLIIFDFFPQILIFFDFFAMNFPFFWSAQDKNLRVFDYVVIGYRLSDNRAAEGGRVTAINPLSLKKAVVEFYEAARSCNGENKKYQTVYFSTTK